MDEVFKVEYSQMTSLFIFHTSHSIRHAINNDGEEAR